MKNKKLLEYDEVKDFVKTKLEKATLNYSKTSIPQKIHFRLLRSLLSNKMTNSTHQLHYYPAKILVDIPNFFLFDDEYAKTGGNMLDPFAGSGTVLLAGLIHPVHQMNTYGVEINPISRLISKVKTTPLNIEKLNEKIGYLINNISKDNKNYDLPIYKNLGFWFVKKAQIELSRIKYHIDKIEDNDIKDFFYICLSSIIRKTSLADPNVPPPVILKSEHFKKKNQRSEIERIISEKRKPNTIKYFEEAVKRNLQKIISFNSAIVNKSLKSQIIWDNVLDFRFGKYTNKGLIKKNNAPKLKNIDIVITSPPYINAQKYVRTLKLELIWLGLLSEEEILLLDKENIGTERVYSEKYKEIVLIDDTLADNTIRKLYKLDKRKAGIVSKYYLDMKIAIKNIYDSLNPKGKFILIVGNNSVLSYKVKNHQILINIAKNIGFEIKLIIKDEIISRGLFTKRHESADIIAEEWIIVLQKSL